jgi:hypothetical protein
MASPAQNRNVAVGVVIGVFILAAITVALLLRNPRPVASGAASSLPGPSTIPGVLATTAVPVPVIAPADQQLIDKLDKKLPEIKFDAVAFSEVIDFLSGVGGEKIDVDWDALTAAGINRNAPVTARLRDVKFSKALEVILRDVGGGKVKLGYTVRDGALHLSTQEKLDESVVTSTYDINDLLINVPAGNGPAATRDRLSQEIITLVKGTVAADSWSRKNISITERDGKLTIVQTPENQRQVAHLLEQLRESQAIQIRIEAKMLVVSDYSAVRNMGAPPSRVGLMAGPGNAPANSDAVFLDDNQIASLKIARSDAAPSVAVLSGQAVNVALFNGTTRENFMIQAIISSDRRYITLHVVATDENGRPSAGALATTISVPDSATLLIKQPSNNGAEQENRWLALKPRLIFQRSAPSPR